VDHEVFVFLDLDGQPVLTGRMWTRVRKSKESATFEYDEEWLRNPRRFSLEPALALDRAPYHTAAGRCLFGAIGDSAPDTWGRALMRRAERREAKKEGRALRTLYEGDILLMVDDETRQGALRFAERPGGPFLRDGGGTRVPPLIELPRLLAATEHIEEDAETPEEIRLLLAPGSSLGGARPKASVHDRDGALAIAKFPHKNDEVSVELWEEIALRLAAKCGINVAEGRAETVGGKPVMILRRFDRQNGLRIPFLSAMSMLSAVDREQHSYMEIADAIRQHGAVASKDIKQLWRRIVFNVLVSNVDDHLRNHGFLYVGNAGWVLSPAYDLNPVPVDLKPRVLCTAIDVDDATASLELALSVADYFGLKTAEAREIAGEVGTAVAKWRGEARKLGVAETEIDRMASAFEHDDLRAARELAITTAPRAASGRN
jgi:serine/threonine-protein kinase HipA